MASKRKRKKDEAMINGRRKKKGLYLITRDQLYIIAKQWLAFLIYSAVFVLLISIEFPHKVGINPRIRLSR